jgi:alkanesulfonate monooxygenase SsuD/methylene tetrahydromethanopterin reductase-like flavin-dependent oxidoreductase (luciferase family)
MSIIDVISRGRLEMGFIKGVPYEIVPANAKPVHVMDRFWEAHDLIIKAMTTHDGPFSWEGEHFQYRSVNIWPRPYQQPHPPVWSSSSSPGSSRALGGRGYVVATVMTGYRAKTVFDDYRKGWKDAGRSQPAPLDRFAYMGFVAVGKKRGGGIAPRRAGEELSADQHAGRRALQESARLHGLERCGQAISTRGLARAPPIRWRRRTANRSAARRKAASRTRSPAA